MKLFSIEIVFFFKLLFYYDSYKQLGKNLYKVNFKIRIIFIKVNLASVVFNVDF